MPVSIVVGGQFGSEGKGKVAHYFSKQNEEIKFVVRCGGPNSGHTVINQKGERRIFQQLPTASILPDKHLAICAGSYIDVGILLNEINTTNLTPERLFIDPNAVIISKEIKERETNGNLIEKISSTGSGTGAAVAARINREHSLIFAKSIPELKPYISDVSRLLRNSINKKERVLIEGTQGFGLSLLHTKLYPYVTSRDTTASAFLSETGLSPIDVDQIILTLRAFPIRVAGNSGPLKNEINWKQLSQKAGLDTTIEERTSVTKKIRRVAKFDSEVVKRAILVNRPTEIVMNHLDYLSSKADTKEGMKKIQSFLKTVETSIDTQINYLGLGPDKIQKRHSMLVS